VTVPRKDAELLQQTEDINAAVQSAHLAEQRIVDLITSVNYSKMRFKTGELVKPESTEEE
jgi:hypothetical protein